MNAGTWLEHHDAAREAMLFPRGIPGTVTVADPESRQAHYRFCALCPYQGRDRCPYELAGAGGYRNVNPCRAASRKWHRHTAGCDPLADVPADLIARAEARYGSLYLMTRALGLSSSMVARIRAGRVRRSTLERIEAAL